MRVSRKILATRAKRNARENDKALASRMVTASVVQNWVVSGRRGRKREVEQEIEVVDSNVRSEVEELLQRGDWSMAKPAHVFALYSQLYDLVYGVSLELSPQKQTRFIRMIARAKKNEFKGAMSEIINLVRWAWKREESTEKWRREKGIQYRKILTVERMFSDDMIAQYKIAKNTSIARRWER